MLVIYRKGKIPLISFYEANHRDYFKSTAGLNPSPFLTPLAKRLPPGATILDVGCGSGRDLRWLANQGFKPTGFELSPSLARLAEDFSGQPVIQGDFTTYDFSTLRFDALLLIGALVHVRHDEFASVLLHICRALREKGLVNLSMKEGDGQYTSHDGRVFSLWEPEHLDEVLHANGFEALDFKRASSALHTKDVWLTYILQKPGA